jgi:uncharacterized membrane protein YdjX (TVP38/TMEM64 family)
MLSRYAAPFSRASRGAAAHATYPERVRADSEPARERRLALIRLGLLAATLATVVAYAAATGFRPSADEVRDWGESLGAAGPILFIPLSIGLACLLFPGPLLAGAAGLLFGTAVGIPVAIVATTGSAVAQMSITRHVAGRRVESLIPERARRIDEVLERRGALAVVYMRLLPGMPFHLINYGAGATRLRVSSMAIGTAIGAMPRTVAYTALGGNLNDLSSPAGIAAITLWAATAIVGAIVARKEIAIGLRRLRAMSYFQFVRLYSAVECVLFTSLLVVWIGELSPTAKTVLGWTHGFGWIILCLLVLAGWFRRIFPGPLLAATGPPLGPLGSTIGFEVLRLRQNRQLQS